MFHNKTTGDRLLATEGISMKLTDMKIGVRLGAGFGMVLLLMAVLVGTGLLRLDKIGGLSESIIE